MSIVENLTLIICLKKKLVYRNIMVTCDQHEKIASSPKVLLGIFLQIRNKFGRYAELNRLCVG